MVGWLVGVVCLFVCLFVGWLVKLGGGRAECAQGRAGGWGVGICLGLGTRV